MFIFLLLGIGISLLLLGLGLGLLFIGLGSGGGIVFLLGLIELGLGGWMFELLLIDGCDGFFFGFGSGFELFLVFLFELGCMFNIGVGGGVLGIIRGVFKFFL